MLKFARSRSTFDLSPPNFIITAINNNGVRLCWNAAAGHSQSPTCAGAVGVLKRPKKATSLVLSGKMSFTYLSAAYSYQARDQAWYAASFCFRNRRSPILIFRILPSYLRPN